MSARTAARALLPAIGMAFGVAACTTPPRPAPGGASAARDSLECGRLLVLAREVDGRPARDVLVTVSGSDVMDHTDRHGRLELRAPCGPHLVTMWGVDVQEQRSARVVLSYGRTDTVRATFTRRPNPTFER
ncbi:MAG TPA: hypothetical protein VFK69_05720 [Candidatus Eisenbacteria bacterium]|nr:hypothetical protein [Candidatus Eisenbacteria bacterium]